MVNDSFILKKRFYQSQLPLFKNLPIWLWRRSFLFVIIIYWLYSTPDSCVCISVCYWYNNVCMRCITPISVTTVRQYQATLSTFPNNISLSPPHNYLIITFWLLLNSALCNMVIILLQIYIFTFSSSLYFLYTFNW